MMADCVCSTTHVLLKVLLTGKLQYAIVLPEVTGTIKG
jgi:hypothetical protein